MPKNAAFYIYILVGYIVVAVQTALAPRMIILLAYDSGGVTIIPASGTGAGEAKTFFGLSLDISTELVLFLLKATIVEPILSAIKGAGRFSERSTGIEMALPVEQTAGMESQMSRTKP